MLKFFLALFIFLISCGNPPNLYKKDLEHVLKISNCDSLEKDTVFNKYNITKWPVTKPHNFSEAMILLDSATNDFIRHEIKSCDGSTFYFELGVTIRNEWVRHGEEELQKQIFDKLNLSHPDYSSGLILFFYKRYLTNDKTSIFQSLKVSDQPDSVKNELLKIDSEINKLRRDK